MNTAIFLLLNLVIFQTINAQETRMRIGAGYNFSSASQHFLSDIESSSNNYSYKKVDASLGRGLEIRGGIDHLFKPWIGISVDANYRKSLPTIKGTFLYSSAADNYYKEENKWTSQLIEISPSLLLKIPGKKINPYSRFGFVVPIYSKIKVTGEYIRITFIDMTTGENEKIFRLKNTLGYTASVGIAPELNKRITFFAEVGLLSQSIQVKRSTLTSDKVNGVEKIDTYNTATKETIYVKKTNNQGYNPDQPRKELGFSLPYSSIGLNAGLSIKL